MRIGGLIKTVGNNLGISRPCCHGIGKVFREGEVMSRAYKPEVLVKSWWF